MVWLRNNWLNEGCDPCATYYPQVSHNTIVTHIVRLTCMNGMWRLKSLWPVWYARTKDDHCEGFDPCLSHWPHQPYDTLETHDPCEVQIRVNYFIIWSSFKSNLFLTWPNSCQWQGSNLVLTAAVRQTIIWPATWLSTYR